MHNKGCLRFVDSQFVDLTTPTQLLFNYYVCAGCATLDSNDVVVSENNNHSHAPNPLQVEVSKAVDKLKDQAAATAAPMASVYRDTVVEILQDPNAAAVAPLLPTLHSLQSALYRKRRKRLPPMPTTIDDATQSGE